MSPGVPSEVRYARSGEISIAYQTLGNGPIDVIMAPGFPSHLEIAWQQPFGENWGILANYSYADGSTADGTPMLGTSDHTYNLGGYFETDNFSARVAYNYRSEFYSGLDRATAFWQNDVKSVDASVGYSFGDHWTVSLDGRNLTDEKIEYFADSTERPRSVYMNGRQYYLNLRFNF